MWQKSNAADILKNITIVISEEKLVKIALNVFFSVSESLIVVDFALLRHLNEFYSF